jgi:hypothetical protein
MANSGNRSLPPPFRALRQRRRDEAIEESGFRPSARRGVAHHDAFANENGTPRERGGHAQGVGGGWSNARRANADAGWNLSGQSLEIPHRLVNSFSRESLLVEGVAVQGFGESRTGESDLQKIVESSQLCRWPGSGFFAALSGRRYNATPAATRAASRRPVTASCSRDRLRAAVSNRKRPHATRTPDSAVRQAHRALTPRRCSGSLSEVEGSLSKGGRRTPNFGLGDLGSCFSRCCWRPWPCTTRRGAEAWCGTMTPT